MIKRSLILFISLFLLYTSSSSQKVDSLKYVLRGNLTVEDKTGVLLSLYESMKEDSLNQALSYIKLALIYEELISDVSLKSKLLFAGGEAYYSLRKIDSSLFYYEKAIELQKQLGDSVSLASTYQEIGLCHYSKNELKKAMEFYLKAEPIIQQEGNEAKTIDLNNRMVFILIQQEQLDQALTYLFTNYKTLRKGSITPETIKTAFNIANCLKRSNKAELALIYADSTAIFSKQVNFDFGLAKALGMQAYILLDLHRPNEALLKIEESEKIFTKMGVDVELFQLEIARSRVMQEKQTYDEMLKSAMKARERLGDIQDLELLQELYDVEYIAYKETSNFSKALQAFEKLSALRDSVFKVENAEKINEMLTKYEAEKKDAEINSLSQQSQIQELEIAKQKNQLIALSVGAVFILLLGFLVVQQRRLRYKQLAFDLEQRMLRLQMNPHFIFNALGAIQNYIQQKNTVESVTYLAKFARLMRQILEHSRQESITIEEEVDMLTNYLEIQRFRFDHKFNFAIIVDDQLDTLTKIPPLFSQPFVENAIEHGLKDKASDGLISVIFHAENGAVRLVIEDNGAGIQEKAPSENHKSLASIITRDRLKLLSKKFKRKFSLSVESAKSGNGTIARILLPELG